MNKATYKQAFLKVLSINPVWKQRAEMDFGKPIEEITERDLLSTLSHEAINALNTVRAEINQHQSVRKYFNKNKRKKSYERSYSNF